MTQESSRVSIQNLAEDFLESSRQGIPASGLGDKFSYAVELLSSERSDWSLETSSVRLAATIASSARPAIFGKPITFMGPPGALSAITPDKDINEIATELESSSHPIAAGIYAGLQKLELIAES